MLDASLAATVLKRQQSTWLAARYSAWKEKWLVLRLSADLQPLEKIGAESVVTWVKT